jgi:hypothetical protein
MSKQQKANSTSPHNHSVMVMLEEMVNLPKGQLAQNINQSLLVILCLTIW